MNIGSYTNLYLYLQSKNIFYGSKYILATGNNIFKSDVFVDTDNYSLEDLIDTNVEPEIGDIIMWSENYYEIDNVTENQLFLGKDNAYSLTDYGSNFGASISLILDFWPPKLKIFPDWIVYDLDNLRAIKFLLV